MIFNSQNEIRLTFLNWFAATSDIGFPVLSEGF
jgi:hypothetical protein